MTDANDPSSPFNDPELMKAFDALPPELKGPAKTILDSVASGDLVKIARMRYMFAITALLGGKNETVNIETRHLREDLVRLISPLIISYQCKMDLANIVDIVDGAAKAAGSVSNFHAEQANLGPGMRFLLAALTGWVKAVRSTIEKTNPSVDQAGNLMELIASIETRSAKEATPNG